MEKRGDIPSAPYGTKACAPESVFFYQHDEQCQAIRLAAFSVSPLTAEDIPKKRAGSGHVVDIKARVFVKYGEVHIIVKVSALSIVLARQIADIRHGSWRREGQVLFAEVREATAFV